VGDYHKVNPASRLGRDCIPGQYLLHLMGPASEHINCHAGLDPASSSILNFRFSRNDRFEI
jgi:hypothetical protein